MQLYCPASDKTKSLSTRTEVMEVPFIVAVMLLAVRGEPSLNQEMSGNGIPEAEHVNDALSVMSAVVFTGGSVIVKFSALRAKSIANL